MQALLAARLVTESWSGSDIQKAALKEGLGMTDVGEELWGPLGKITMQVRTTNILVSNGFIVHIAMNCVVRCAVGIRN
jgi:hypothetical protein